MLKHAMLGAAIGGVIGLVLGGPVVGAVVGTISGMSVHFWNGRRVRGLLVLLGLGFAGGAVAQSTETESAKSPVFFEERGEGPVILLVHGGMMDRHMWEPQWEGLADEFRLIRFDVRGAGESPPSDAFHPADDMLAILDALEVEQAHIVGLSNGGAFAVDFALAYPERVDMLILAEPALTGFQFPPSVMQQQMKLIAAFRARDMEEATRVALASPVFDHTRRKHDAWVAVERLIRRNVASFAMFPQYRFHESQAVDALAELTVPTALIVSEFAGPSAIEIADLIQKDVPDLVRFAVPDAGHMMNLENPVAFNRIIEQIVAE
jgi:pimeloyl-ACP methyl ester carboxylesterase